ncbi:MAG: helix-turn-helix domain-containing protein [Anaerolineae bacterium]|nr:helix-turn-helix domain-containing protein [Anaerolineae bacterium]
MKKKGQASTLRSVDRAIAVLKAFSEEEPELGVTELSRRLQFPKSTVYRLLASLQREGVVDQDPETEKYRLGIELVRLAGLVLKQIDVRQVARPYLRSLAEASEETVNLSVLTGGGKVINIDGISSPRIVRNVGWIGREMLPHCISSGKALLAYLPQQRLERVLARGLPRFTEKTIVDPILLREELKRVRQQGYAVAQEELEVGLSAVAAPIWNHEGEVVAAVSVSGPSFRLSSRKIPELAELTKRTANEISHQLGYVGEE